ncbi:DUF2848 family protein [Mammaliicoccus vitulinus]|uniref:DUF2848 family protein n=1 Tax=Mammaliicoccus vitulinus TaxID=71237 RepID=UPI003BA32BAB
MEFKLGYEKLDLSFEHAYCIGYSGRDVNKTKAHINELKALGVPEPDSIPEIYHLEPYLFRQEKNISIIGERSSGEAEIVVIFDGENRYVTLGSDHTDRELETVSIHKSKQLCAKPIAQSLWKFEDVEKHWDDLELRSYVQEDGEWTLYQEDKVSGILPYEKLIESLNEFGANLNKTVVYCGTVPLVNGFKYPEKFKAELVDSVQNKTIRLEYGVSKL